MIYGQKSSLAELLERHPHESRYPTSYQYGGGLLKPKEPWDLIYGQESPLAEFLERHPYGSRDPTSPQPDVFIAENIQWLFYNPQQDLEQVRRRLEALDTPLPSLDILLLPNEEEETKARYSERVAFISKEETAFRERVEAAKKAGTIDSSHYERIMTDLISPSSPFEEARREAGTKYSP